MNISHVIHPEIVFGTRGNKNVTSLYQELFKHIQKTSEGDYRFVAFDRGADWFRRMASFADSDSKEFERAYAIQKEFKISKSPIYYLPQNFCEALFEIDKTIDSRFLPDSFLGYFVLPHNKYYEDTGHFPVNGIYVPPSADRIFFITR